MGCKSCEKKELKNSGNGVTNGIKDTIEESGINNGVFIYKVFAFVVMIIALPILLVVLMGQIFYFFFFPKKLEKISSSIRNYIKKIGKKRIEKEKERQRKRREKQFEDNRGYEEDSELVNVSDVEVYDNNSK